MRRAVFVGNRQMEVLARLYRAFDDGERVGHSTYIAAHVQPSDDDWKALAAADVIVEQLQDFKPKIDLSDLPGNAERVLAPVASGGFLWPFAGQGHPRNPSLPYLKAGPYPAELGDAYLNRMINRGADPQAAVAAYLALDVNDLVDLDRLYEKTLEKQRQRDAATGFSIAEIIAEHFRDEPVFLTPLHPNTRVALALADQLFRRLDIGAADLARLHRTMRAPPFPADELPIHPSVARHFGLRYIGEGHRFRFRDEGRFTFAEHALRYMECRWNMALAEGLALAEGGDPATALDRLRAGLAVSPAAASGHAALGRVLARIGQREEAIEAARRAVALAPEDASYHGELAALLRDAGRFDEAERECRTAITLDPADARSAQVLVDLLRRSGHREEGLAVARAAVETRPDDLDGLIALAQFLIEAGDLAAAEAALRRAIAIAPQDAHAYGELGFVLSETDRHGEAIAMRRKAVELEPDNPYRHAQLGHTYREACDFLSAEEALFKAIDLAPQTAEFHISLSHVFARAGRSDEAAFALSRAVALAPENAAYHAELGEVLGEAGDHAEAERALRAALALDPGNARLHLQLSRTLAALDRIEEARETAQEAVRLDPENEALQHYRDSLEPAETPA
jgi:tetratricopeptide (TPR) repeat protein